MKKFKYTLIIGGLFQLLLIPGCHSSETSNPPNLVYVFTDQQRIHALEFWESPQFKGAIRTKADPVKTPNINKLAEESVVLTNMVSTTPICSPHRGSLMTGMYAGSSGVPLNCNSSRPISSLRQDIPGFSNVLAQEGYDTGYIGKWHLDYPQPNDPQNPGQYVESRRPSWDAYTPKERRHGFKYWYSYGTFDVHKNPHYWDAEGNRYDPEEYSAKHDADKAISYLKNTDGQRDPEKP